MIRRNKYKFLVVGKKKEIKHKETRFLQGRSNIWVRMKTNNKWEHPVLPVFCRKLLLYTFLYIRYSYVLFITSVFILYYIHI